MGALYRTAARLTSRVAEAEDLVQETYLEGLRSFASLRDPGRCRAWLFRILHNLWSDRVAREQARRLARGFDNRPAGNLEKELLDGGYSDEVERELRGLPPEFRTALLLVTVEEMSYAEVAEVMGCPIGTVRSRVARARALLATALCTERETMDERPAEPEPRKESL